MTARLRVTTVSLLAIVALLAPATGARADTFTVNTTADAPVTAGNCTVNTTCSLRDAVAAADALDGSNTIVVPAGNYSLTEGALAVGQDGAAEVLTVRGAGARSTVIGAGGLSRVFEAFDSDGDDGLTLEDLTVTGGFAGPTSSSPTGDGGGVLLSGPGAYTFRRVAIVGNTATLGGAGIYGEFETTGAGGSPTVVIEASTIAGNSVTGGAGNAQGGGLAVFGLVTITNSTITGNSLANPGINEGAGLVSAKDASDMSAEPQPLTLVNSTVAGNTITGGTPATNFGAGLSGDNIGVGPFNTELIARNSIIAGNTADGAPSDCAFTNTATTDHNISSDASCGFADAGSLQDTDPALAPLGDAGGPTDTLRPAAASPAVNGGVNDGCAAADQRGVVRPVGGTCDIGAVELAPPVPVTGGASAIEARSATLNADVTNPFVAAATASFQLGTTTGYGATVAAAPGIPAGAAPQRVTGQAADLEPATVYHYRAVALNGDGLAVGADRTFRTGRLAGARPRLVTRGVPRACTKRPFTLRVRARVSGTGVRVRSVVVRLDGRRVRRATRARFSVRIKAGGLRSGRHAIRVVVTDTRGRKRARTLRFRHCARPRPERPRRRPLPEREPRFTG